MSTITVWINGRLELVSRDNNAIVSASRLADGGRIVVTDVPRESVQSGTNQVSVLGRDVSATKVVVAHDGHVEVVSIGQAFELNNLIQDIVVGKDLVEDISWSSVNVGQVELFDIRQLLAADLEFASMWWSFVDFLLVAEDKVFLDEDFLILGVLSVEEGVLLFSATESKSRTGFVSIGDVGVS